MDWENIYIVYIDGGCVALFCNAQFPERTKPVPEISDLCSGWKFLLYYACSVVGIAAYYEPVCADWNDVGTAGNAYCEKQQKNLGKVLEADLDTFVPFSEKGK